MIQHTHPLALVSIAAPKDTTLLAQWETHLQPLRQAGFISVWSELHLTPGTDRVQEFQRQIDGAALVLLLLSADFFASLDCQEMMTQALQRSSAGITRVIPLLLRSVAWQESSLGHLTPWPSNGKPITLWSDKDEGWHACIQELRRLLGRRVSLALPSEQATTDHVLPQTSSTELPPSPQKTLSSELLVPTPEHAENWSQIDTTEKQDIAPSEKEVPLGEKQYSANTALPPINPPSKNLHLSRRTLLIAGISVASVGIMGTLLAQHFVVSNAHHLVASSSTMPVGTTIYTYKRTAEVEATTWLPSLQQLRVACASTNNNIYVWDAVTGKHLLIYSGHRQSALGVSWSPDGKFLASASADATVQIWDAVTANPAFIYTGHQQDVHDVDWSPNGKFLASCSSDATVQVWDWTTRKQLLTYRHNAAVSSAKWSHDGMRIVSGSVDGTIQIWDVHSKKQLLNLPAPDAVFTVAWSPDGRYIASAGNKFTYGVDVWNAQAGTKVYSYNQHSNLVRRIAWAPDGHRLASASFDKTVHVWDALSGEHPYVYNQHTHWVVGLGWSFDGTYIASGSYDKTVRIWKASLK